MVLATFLNPPPLPSPFLTTGATVIAPNPETAARKRQVKALALRVQFTSVFEV